MKRFRMTMVGALALTMLTTLATVPAQASDGATLTPAQRDQVVQALIAEGSTQAQAEAIASDDAAASLVTVDTGSSTEMSKPVKITPTGGNVQAALGTCHTGDWSASYTTKIWGISPAGIKTWWIQLTVNWCYNNSAVTYAAYNKTAGVYSGSGSDYFWYFEGWNPDTQYFYTSGGHVNGGVLTQVQGRFRFCVAYKIGCIQSANPWIQERVYWNGTAIRYYGS